VHQQTDDTLATLADALQSAIRARGFQPSHRLILADILIRAGREGRWPLDLATISVDLGLSHATVKDGLLRLELRGLIRLSWQGRRARAVGETTRHPNGWKDCVVEVLHGGPV
jgi:hypothetical protein